MEKMDMIKYALRIFALSTLLISMFLPWTYRCSHVSVREPAVDLKLIVVKTLYFWEFPRIIRNVFGLILSITSITLYFTSIFLCILSIIRNDRRNLYYSGLLALTSSLVWTSSIAYSANRIAVIVDVFKGTPVKRDKINYCDLIPGIGVLILFLIGPTVMVISRKKISITELIPSIILTLFTIILYGIN